MEVFTVVLAIPHPMYGGTPSTPYPKPAYSQLRITNVPNYSTIHQTLANLMSLSMFLESTFH